MTINSILHQLLLSHECVIIPGFGGFIVRESPCTLNTAKDRIKPYSKTVFFNQHLQENDGLLVSEVSKLHGISYAEALLSVEKWVSNTNQDIINENKASINELGIFYKGNENNKWFSPNLNLNLSLKSYGLKSADLEMVYVEKDTVKLATEKVYEPVLTIADRAPIEKLNIPKTNWKAWLAAASIALVAHIGYLSLENYNTPKNQASIIPTLTKETPSVPEISKEIIPEVKEEAMVQSETVVVSEIPIINEQPETEKPVETITATPELENALAKNELIIAGQYRLEQNAINHQLDLSKKGIQAEVKQNEKGLYQVLTSK